MHIWLADDSLNFNTRDLPLQVAEWAAGQASVMELKPGMATWVILRGQPDSVDLDYVNSYGADETIYIEDVKGRLKRITP